MPYFLNQNHYFEQTFSIMCQTTVFHNSYLNKTFSMKFNVTFGKANGDTCNFTFSSLNYILVRKDFQYRKCWKLVSGRLSLEDVNFAYL